jgi:SAM-dependent methyltransferase
MLSLRLWRDIRSYYRGCRERDLQEFYDLESRLPYFDHVSRILGVHKRRIFLRWIGRKPVCGPVLELGSGIGTLARQLGLRGYQVLAVDISAAKTLKAQRLTAKRGIRESARVHHFVGDLRDLGSGMALDLEIQEVCKWPMLQKVDVLLAADVLEHVPEPPHDTLQRIRALLAPHGRVFYVCPFSALRQRPWPLLDSPARRVGTGVHREWILHSASADEPLVLVWSAYSLASGYGL